MTAAMTSRIAYHGVQADGTEHNQKALIVAALNEHGPMTRRELSVATGIEPGAIGGRVNALVAAGKLKDDTQRPCTVTGKLVKEVRLHA